MNQLYSRQTHLVGAYRKRKSPKKGEPKLEYTRGRLPYAPATLWRMVNDGTFPPPLQLGKRLIAWRDDEVDAVLRARDAGMTNDEIRELVKRLVAARKQIPEAVPA